MVKKQLIDDLATYLNMRYGKDKDWIKKNLFEVDEYFIDFLDSIIRK